MLRALLIGATVASIGVTTLLASLNADPRDGLVAATREELARVAPAPETPSGGVVRLARR